MKRLFLILIFLFTIVPIAYAAQEQGNELANSITLLISAFGALVANFIIDYLKTIPYLGQPDKDKLAQATLEVISVVVGLITGYGVALLGQYLGAISDSNLQAMVIAALTPVLNELRYRLVKLAPQK